jgi:hypothetical protein
MTLQRPVFLLNSRPALFSAAHVLGGHPFSRSYGVNVPSSLTTYHPSALEYSSRPPVSVCGTDTLQLLRGFSWQTNRRICLSGPPLLHCWKPLPTTDLRLRPPFGLDRLGWSRNVNRVSIGYAFRPHLRIRLTLSGLTLLRKP